MAVGRQFGNVSKFWNASELLVRILGLVMLFLSVDRHLCCGEKLVLLDTAAKEKGAVCLDGSPGGYYFRQGQGAGVNKWILYYEGGGWCWDKPLCVGRSNTSSGSSKFWPQTDTFGGLLSSDSAVNPDFYNWNVAYMKYCDGASFSGNVSSPVVYNKTTIYFRGIRILQSGLDDILTRGMKNAKEVIITGCSAGGIATLVHVDYVRSRISSSAYVRALVDAGFFLDVKNWTGQHHIRPLYQYVFNMQNCSGGVNSDCIAGNQGQEWMCFFAQYTFPYIKTPLFLLNSLYDIWQLEYILQLSLNCIDSPQLCPNDQQKTAFRDFRNDFLNASRMVDQSTTSGVFLPACVDHCLALIDSTWSSVAIQDTVASSAFHMWYSGKSPVHFIDGAYPSNGSCRNRKN